MLTDGTLDLTHLGLFIVDAAAPHAPVSRLPVYAEVGLGATPGEVDPRFADDDLVTALRRADEESDDGDAARRRIVGTLAVEISRVLTPAARDTLAADRDRKVDFLTDALRGARTALGRRLADARPDELRGALKAAIRAEAQRRDLGVTGPDAAAVTWAHPLGILATDHAGYLSFDLTRLPPGVRAALHDAVRTRRDTPTAPRDLTVWLYPLAAGVPPIDALEQGRFTRHAVVARLALTPPHTTAQAARLGFPALQRPDLVDWELSPVSFAVNGAAILGDGGCETLLPANVAVQEFRFYQAVGLRDPGAQPPGLGDAAALIRAGVVNRYRMAWFHLGHSLGPILYSLPLAPGESVNIAVVDWSHTTDAERTEDTKVDEQLVHSQHRERAITETVDAALREYQAGSSSMAGFAASAGASGSIGVAGAALGLSGAIGGASSDSSGSRDLSATTVQQLSDRVAQASAASRELRSTVVVHANQSEKEAIETRTVVNYNHSHALTILYYEVLRHLRLVTELTAQSPAVLVKVRADHFAGTDLDAARTAVRHQAALRASLLDPRLDPAFEAAQRWIRRGGALPPLPAAPPAPAVRFRFFIFEMTVGGIAVEDRSDADVDIEASLFGSASVRLVNQAAAGGPSPKLDPPGAFGQKDAVERFVAMPQAPGPVNWADLDGMALAVNLSRTFISFKHIKVIGVDSPGRHEHVVLDQSYANGHLVISESTQLTLPLLPPPPAPPAPPGYPADVLDDQARTLELLAHLRENAAHYGRAVMFHQNPGERARYLQTIRLADGSGVLDHVENRPLEFVSTGDGDFIAFPCTDEAWRTRIAGVLEPAEDDPGVLDERLITLPTRGVFADARLGHCNASEEIDNTRFWDWQQSPIPHTAAEIAAINAVTPRPEPTDLTPTALPQPIVNIVNPPAAPDPTGLAAAVAGITTPNVFRDMSGRAELNDLLKRLSDNSVSIAEASSIARGIQAKQAHPGGGVAPVGGPGAPNGAVGGPRATPTEPSTTSRDLHDLQRVLGNAEERGLLSPQDSRELYTTAARNAVTPDGTAHLLFGVAVPDPAEWRPLARAAVPWSAWTREQKIRAMDERQAAWNRLLNGTRRPEDRETLDLVEPYRADMRDFAARTVKVILAVTPFQTANAGDRVTLTAQLFLPGGPPPAGQVTFSAELPLGRQSLGTRNVADGKASVSTTALPKGPVRLIAEYPDQTVADPNGGPGQVELNGGQDRTTYTIT
ncbi:hypothetical protein Val02_29680 [Virgisporangium aliadipatigenens]|uniref:Uncharacterized protein n=1 Tax=Virgisporangium aliadipatigenens TaxID=741659 RepID=A0A8J3YKH3_9ACTN|nr:Ig-like domain-containing protein [Virgisporangium aliadipatigenens]GIJ46082.1 hypothetical protein Val02_29680 [Virgisporangium aliadipatigenens]